METVLIERDLYNPYEVHGPPLESDEARAVWITDEGVQVTLRPLIEDAVYIEIKGEDEAVARLIRIQMLRHACVEPRTARQVGLASAALGHLGLPIDEVGYIIFAMGVALGSELDISPEMEEELAQHYESLREAMTELGVKPEINLIPEDFEDE